MSITAMIVDDEPFAREDLRYMLSEDPDIEVKWEADRVDEAKRLLADICPDVIFLDIDLRGGSGFEVITDIDPKKTIVIFVTGHDEYRKKAIKTGALDCILKPVSPDYISKSLKKLKQVIVGRDR